MARTWNGFTKSETLKPEHAEVCSQLIEAAKNNDWDKAVAIISAEQSLVNVWRPGGKAWYTPLHHAAYNGAPLEIVQSLVELGAWRALRTAEGERAVDIASRRGQAHLLEILEPVFSSTIPLEVLKRIQGHFHAVILERARGFVEEHALRLPELEPMLEYAPERTWFAIPGMYGGFNYWLEQEPAILLWAESWSRVVGGSGQSHAISPFGSLLVEEGFV